MVADMALAMGMTVVGFDPVLSIDAAWRLSNEVSRMENLQSLLARSDYVSLHVPAVDATRHMINDDTLAVIKPGAVLLNFARDAIVDSAAVLRSLDAGRLGKYVCDFPEPVLLGHPKIIAMPHIGASTEESEENCAVMAANQLVDYLENGNIVNSVNFPKISMERSPGTSRITFSNDNVSGVLGHVLSVLADNKVNVVDMVNKSRGELAFNIMDVERARQRGDRRHQGGGSRDPRTCDLSLAAGARRCPGPNSATQPWRWRQEPAMNGAPCQLATWAGRSCSAALRAGAGSGLLPRHPPERDSFSKF
jgi:D-3-phosphoglycerate dehydrogenase